MSQFSRQATWLRRLFPASVLPTVADPGSVSDDVSLVQPYDGSGWGFPSPSDWCRPTISAVGATGFTLNRVVGPDEVFRILAAHVIIFLGGGSPTFVGVNVIDNEGTGDQVFISEILDLAGLGSNVVYPIRVYAPIVGPNCHLRLDYLGGDAATAMTLAVYGALAPIGTSFNV